MNKKVMVIAFILILAAAVSLLTFSYLWFNSEVNINIQSPQLEATPLNLSLDVDIVTSQPSYMGQTGKDAGLDSPYSVDFDVEMVCNKTESDNLNLRLNIKEMDIKMWNYVEAQGGNPAENYYLLTEEQIADNFTWRIIYLEKTYRPDAQGYMYRMDSSRKVYLTFCQYESVQYTLRMIYLGEQKYQLWQQARYSEYDEFEFCAPDFMDARFRFAIDFQLSSAQQEFSSELGFDVKDNNFISSRTGNSLANTYVFAYEPQIMPYAGVSGGDKAVRAYIENVTIIKANNEVVVLDDENIENNFTLRITQNNFKNRPSGDVSYINYMFESYGQSTIWMTMQRNTLANIKVEVVYQSEEDYQSMLLGLAGYPQTTFAYATGEYAGAKLHFSINYDMVDIPTTSSSYSFTSITTMGRFDAGYDGKNGSSEPNTYLFNNNISWRPTVSNKVRLTITGVTILRKDGVTQILTSNQIDSNFSLRVVYGGYTWTPYDGALQARKDFMSRLISPLNYDFLELNANTTHNVNMIIAYSSGSSFAYTASQYVGATFCFDVKIEVINYF